MSKPQQKFYLVTKRKEEGSALIKAGKIAVVVFAIVGVVSIISRFFSAPAATPSGASLPKPATAMPSRQIPETMPADKQFHPTDGTNGRLEISSNPPGLHYKVFAGQRGPAADFHAPALKPVSEGTTPAHLEDIANGIVTVVISRPGWEDQTKEVNVGAGQAIVGAEFRGGTLSVAGVPAGSEVLLDGVLVGITPLKIEAAPGPHEVSATYQEKATQTENVSIVAGRESQVALKFGAVNHAHHAKAKPKPPESEWQKIQNSLKKFFSPDKKAAKHQ